VLDPTSVALKFGFLAVLYLFLLWVSRSALRDLRGGAVYSDDRGEQAADATGLYATASPGAIEGGQPQLVVERAPGHAGGLAYDIGDGATLGRGDGVEIRLEDPFASSHHARLTRQGAVIVLEDLGSTNGTYLNEEILQGPQPLHPGDRVRIGDSEFTYEDR
jgi:pSer/pThr/pTyr-binding forkhead associated (FHA) protein